MQPTPSLTLAGCFAAAVLSGCGGGDDPAQATAPAASATIINGLRGIDVQVIQIGGSTCGKPYAFVPTDNCGTTYFAIQLAARNAKGYGAYADGFETGGSGGAGVPGCKADDDFGHALGSGSQRLLAEALTWRSTGRCSAPPAQANPYAARGRAETPVLVRPEFTEIGYWLPASEN